MNRSANDWWLWTNWFSQPISQPAVNSQPTVNSVNTVWRSPLEWISADFYRVLSYVALHSLWQGVFIATLLWLVLRGIPARRTSARYALTCVSLMGFVLVVLITGAILNLPPNEPAPSGNSLASDDSRTISNRTVPGIPRNQSGLVSVHPAESIQPNTSRQSPTTSGAYGTRWPEWTQWLSWGWLVGSAVMLARVARALLQTRALVQNSLPLPADVASQFESLLDELQRVLGLRQKLRCHCSDWLNVPAVCGAVWPVLLLPTAMVTGIPLDQWRVILAHELAHIRRHDYFVNVLQMVIEATFYFNPAVWWISRQMRREREACCDAIAVAATGQPLAVARALVNVADWVRHGTGQSPRTLVAWQRIDGNQPVGELSDRVHRLALPEHPPRLRMPWYSLLGVLLGSGLVVFCLHLGASMAVKTVAQILSPRERVAKLVDLDRRLTNPFSPGENPQNAADHAPIQPIEITGTLSRTDGAALPAKTSLNSIEFSKNSTTHSTVIGMLQNNADAAFRVKLRPGSILYLIGQSEGSAPAIVGPISVKNGERVEPQKIQFTPGFHCSIRLVDEKQNPIVGANVSAFLSIRHLNSASGAASIPKTQSDQNGIVRFANAVSTYPYDVNFDAPGYQMSRKSFAFAPDQTVEWKIPHAHPTQGQVLSDTTGKPVANAELYLIEAQAQTTSSSSQSWGVGDPRTAYASKLLFAQTDKDGRFELNTLADEITYRFYIRSTGHRPMILDDVYAGEKYPAIRLLPALTVKGRILGATTLPKRYGDTDETRQLSYGNVLRSHRRGTTYSSGLPFEVKIVDGVGHFELKELFPERLTLQLGSRTEELELSKSIEDLVIDLNQPPPPPKTVKKRRVSFYFTGIEDPAAVSGELKVSFYGGGASSETSSIVKGGRADIEAPIGASMFIEGKQLIGCWIDRLSDVVVTDGTEPLMIELPAVAAGAIEGRVLNADGSPCESFDATIILSQTPASLGQKSLLNVESRSETPGKFLFQQLPLNGAYRILIRSRENQSLATQLSQPIVINEETPIQSTDIRLDAGQRLTVRVRDEHGTPAPHVGFRLTYSVSGDRVSHGFSKTFETDEKGVAKVEDVNWQVLQNAGLEIEPTKNRQGIFLPLSNGQQEALVELKQGMQVSGKIVDAATGRPVPYAKIRVAPRTFQVNRYSGWINTQADAQGEFHFGNLASQIYRVYVEEAYPADAIIKPLPDGRNSVSVQSEFPAIDPADSASVTIPVQLPPKKATP